jgi:hypothetical protein
VARVEHSEVFEGMRERERKVVIAGCCGCFELKYIEVRYEGSE